MKRIIAIVIMSAAAAVGAFERLPSVFDGKTPVVIETKTFKLVINPDATAKSLVVKATGEEMLEPREGIPVFATTQIRPFNNEIRLVQQAKRTTYPANRVRRDGNLIRVGFETAPYEVEVRVDETAAGYVVFRPVRLISNTEQEHQYWHWNMDVPPVDSFRLLQLPVKNRENFGDWLNVMWDGRGCVGVMGGTPHMDVDNERRWGFRRLTVESLKDYGVTNGVAVLAAAATPAEFLDQIDAAEAALCMPRGVKSRRDSRLNASLYWTADIRPGNVDEILSYAKAGGFRMLLIYYPALVSAKSYRTLPDYSWSNGWSRESFSAAVRKFNEAGISVGLHTLQTFIGFDSKYVTPEADHRLALVKHYTLSRPLPASEESCDVYVEQNPIAAPMHPKCRVLKFGTELMEYTGFVAERPYRFTGVKRRHLGTTAKEHPLGEIGGVLGVSECAAISGYVDQDTSLQDEIGDKIAEIYDCGLEFLYFDGSEDANPPCTVNISLSQIRCVDRCMARTGRQPLFTEGCAKSHFGWHLQSGANAFDVFSPELFKEKIIEYPYAAAKRLAKDFTRVDFGWWKFGPPVLKGPPPKREGLWSGGCKTVGVQPDIWEYGTSKAAAFDCPSTMQMSLVALRSHKRTTDILATMRRWEDVRARKWLTTAQKEMLKDPAREFHLLDDGKGGYELVEWKQLDVAGGKWTDIRAFFYERNGKRVVVYWHVQDAARLVFAKPIGGVSGLDVDDMKSWETTLSAEEIRNAFASAAIVPAELPLGVPARHKPIATMGRDCWRVLNKYSSYGCTAMPTVGWDNKELNADPALVDVAYCYVASAEPPPPSSGLAVWTHLKDYFRKGEPDAEILTTNPNPDRPFFLCKRSERNRSTWGSPVNVDMEEYRAWCATHPNLVVDGNLSEWCNDLNNAYMSAEGKRGMYIASLPDSEERMAALRKFLGERPKTRYEQLELLKRYYEMRKERNFGGKMSVLDAHINSLHVAADFGASLIRMETTSSGQYRYQSSAMFTRGASRQFGIPWEWYIAGYVNGYATNGWYLGDSCCRYPSSVEDAKKYPRYGKPRPASWTPTGEIRIGCGGLEFGISRALFRRTHYLAYLSGANFIQLEEWGSILKMWSTESGKTVFSPRGKIYADFAKFMREHPDRGAHYSPVAVCVPLAQGYQTWGGSPWGNQKFGYTEGDKAVDAVFYTLVPGYDYNARLVKGDEMCLRNTPYANMYDVIVPDAKSQTPEQVLEVMKSYKALVVAGDYRDHEWEKSLAKYEAEGGKVVRVDAEMLKDAVKSGKGRGVYTGEVRYPKLEATFAALQDEFFPFKVEGRCMYGLTVAGSHVWLYVFNNDGVTKFADAPQALDETKASNVRVSPRTFAPRFVKVSELISGKSVATDGNASFTWRIGPGDFAVFEVAFADRNN